MATYNIRENKPTAAEIATGDILNCPPLEAGESVTVPSGLYFLECWGSEGAIVQDTEASRLSGLGGYSSGYLQLLNQTTLYLYTGSYEGTSSSGNRTFNGGGGGEPNGGGGTHIAVADGELYTFESHKDDVILVAGGGGGKHGRYSTAGTGYGGGLIGGAGRNNNSGGTQTTPGSSYSPTAAATFGQGANRGPYVGCGGGGGGWYGGGVGGNANGAGGSGHINERYFQQFQTICGNETITEPDGTTHIGHQGKGYIRITCINTTTGDIVVNIYSTNSHYEGNCRGNIGDAINGALVPTTNYTFANEFGGSVSVISNGRDITSTAYNPNGNNISFLLEGAAEIRANAITYSLTATLTGCTANFATSSYITPGGSFIGTITPATNYSLNPRYGATIVVEMNGIDITDTAWNSNNNTITIIRVTGNISIRITAITFGVTVQGDAVLTPSLGSTIMPGSSYTGTVSLPSGHPEYSLKRVDNANIQIHMGGVDITNEVWDEASLTFYIPFVTGDLWLLFSCGYYRFWVDLYDMAYNSTNWNYRYDAIIGPHQSSYGYINIPPLYSWAGASYNLYMANVDITATNYDPITHYVSLPNVTGNIHMTGRSVAPYTLSIADIASDTTKSTNVYTVVAYNDTMVSKPSSEVIVRVAQVPHLENTTKYYNGTPQAPIIIDGDQPGIVQSGDITQTDPGTYTITWDRNTEVMWAEATSAARSEGSKTAQWTIAAHPIPVEHNIPSNLTFSDAVSTREYDLRISGAGCLIGEQDTVGDISWEFTGTKIKLTAHNTFTGDLTLSFKGATGYEDTAIQTIHIVSTKTYDKQYGDGDLNNVGQSYEGRVLLNGSAIYESTEEQQASSYAVKWSRYINLPDFSDQQHTPLSQIIPVSSSTEAEMPNWGWNCLTYGELHYQAYNVSGINQTIALTAPLNGNTAVHIYSYSSPGMLGGYKFKCSDNWFTLEEMVNYGIINPLVLIDASANRSDRIAWVSNALTLYTGGVPGYCSSSYYGTGSFDILFTINPGYTIDAIFAANWNSSYGNTGELKVGYCPSSLVSLTLTPEEVSE